MPERRQVENMCRPQFSDQSHSGKGSSLASPGIHASFVQKSVMPESLDEYRQRYDAVMRAGAEQYADVIERLNAEGLPTHFTQTSGMNAALEVQLETGRTLLITNYDDSLAWVRAEQQGWGVGLYEASEAAADEPIHFVSSEDVSTVSLLGLIKKVLFHRRD